MILAGLDWSQLDTKERLEQLAGVARDVRDITIGALEKGQPQVITQDVEPEGPFLAVVALLPALPDGSDSHQVPEVNLSNNVRVEPFVEAWTGPGSAWDPIEQRFQIANHTDRDRLVILRLRGDPAWPALWDVRLGSGGKEPGEIRGPWDHAAIIPKGKALEWVALFTPTSEKPGTPGTLLVEASMGRDDTFVPIGTVPIRVHTTDKTRVLAFAKRDSASVQGPTLPVEAERPTGATPAGSDRVPGGPSSTGALPASALGLFDAVALTGRVEVERNEAWERPGSSLPLSVMVHCGGASPQYLGFDGAAPPTTGADGSFSVTVQVPTGAGCLACITLAPTYELRGSAETVEF